MKSHKIGDFARNIVTELQGEGRYSFSLAEFIKRYGRSRVAAYQALRRMVKAGELILPRSGFYVVVDPQHRRAGTLPPEWFVDAMMKYLVRPYYVGLLSAAQMYGAAHHHPLAFQVVVAGRRIRPVRVGNAIIQFHGKGPFITSELRDVKTPTGTIKVSSPETTAWDLVRYCRVAGGMENVITVLSELAEQLDRKRLLKTVERHREVIVGQRLGYLLERVRRKDLAQGLERLAKHAPLRGLDPAVKTKRCRIDRKWNLAVNVDLRPEA